MNQSPTSNKNERVIAVVLVLCLVIVGFWEVMSRKSERGDEAFRVTAEKYADFRFRCSGWRVEKSAVSFSPTEPEILKYDLYARSADNGRLTTDDGGQKTEGRGQRTEEHVTANVASKQQVFSVRTRLTHGYNMVDCMRIKGYAVRLLHDSRTTDNRLPTTLLPGRVQVWELENSVGDKSIWATSMVRVGDLCVLDIQTTDMAFPKVGVPDNPDWLPTGFKLSSLKHPVRAMRYYMRAKWNAARFDPWVFLSLKKPLWADDEILTLVTNSKGGVTGKDIAADVLRVHGKLYSSLLAWQNDSRQ